MSAETSGATARPWKVGKHFPEFVYGANKKDGFIVDCGPDDRNAANARLIVAAVNSYDAHKALEDAARAIVTNADTCLCFHDADWWLNNEPRPADGGHTDDCPVKILRAALAEIDKSREGGAE